MLRSVAGALAAAVLLASCTSLPEEPPPADWIELRADDYFSLRAPPGTTYVPLQGLDSYVGEFRNEAFTLTFDYGGYNLTLDDALDSHPISGERVTVDGKRAAIYSHRVTMPEEGECRDTFAGLVTEELSDPHRVPVSEGEYVIFPADSLHIFACVTPGDTVATVKRIFRTVRFGNPVRYGGE